MDAGAEAVHISLVSVSTVSSYIFYAADSCYDDCVLCHEMVRQPVSLVQNVKKKKKHTQKGVNISICHV